jgi:hypothetical protein
MFVDWLVRPLLIISPALIGGLLHSISIRLRLFPRLAVPLSERLFGRSKTYRGFLLMPIACVIGVYAAARLEQALPPEYAVGFGDVPIAIAGVSLGLAYMLFELPNSFLKRRAGIKEGTLGAGRWRWAFFVADQADSSIGCLLVCWFFLQVPITLILATFLVGIPVHVATSLGLYLTGIRRQPV